MLLEREATEEACAVRERELAELCKEKFAEELAFASYLCVALAKHERWIEETATSICQFFLPLTGLLRTQCGKKIA